MLQALQSVCGVIMFFKKQLCMTASKVIKIAGRQVFAMGGLL